MPQTQEDAHGCSKKPYHVYHYHVRQTLLPLCNVYNPNLHLPHLHPFCPRLLPHARHRHDPIIAISHGDEVALILYLALEPTLQLKLLPHLVHERRKRDVRRQHYESRIIPVVDLDPHILQSIDVLTGVGGAPSAAGLAARARKPAAGVVEDFVLVEGGGCGCRAGVLGRFFVDAVVLPPLPALRAAAPPLPLAAGVGGVVVRGAGFLRRAVLAGGARVHRVEFLGILVEVRFVAVGVRAVGGSFAEQTGPRGAVALAVVVWTAGGGAAGLGGGAGGADARLFSGDCFKVEGFGAQGLGGRGIGEGVCSRERLWVAGWRG